MKEIYKYLLIFVGSMFIFPTLSHAECSYERQAELSRIAGNVQASYNYSISGDRPEFVTNITNITNDIYVIERSTNKMITNETNGFEEDMAGETVIYDVYSNDNNCKGELLTSKYVTLPSYNNFSNIEDCEDYPEFKYCQIWMNTENVSQDHFEQELEKHKEEGLAENDKGQSSENILQNFFNQNKTWIIITFSSFVLIILLIVIKRRLRK